MNHLLAFTKSVAAASANEQLPGVFDGWASLSSNLSYLLPQPMRVQGAYAQGATITRAQLVAPTLRAITLPQIQPVEVAAAPASLAPMPFYPPGQNKLQATDEVSINTSNAAAGAERHIAGLFLTDGVLNVDQGDIITISATAAITAGNLAWGPGAFTLETGLPVGRYAVVGMDVVGANLIFARLVFPNGGVKPGVLARQAMNITPKPEFRFGRAGTFGYFETVSQPGIELFGSAAPTTQTIFLDVIKIR